MTSTLSSDQQRALDPTLTTLVVAGAGSGKTRVLVARYLELVRLGLAEPREIVAITFTEKAAAELRSRLALALTDLGFAHLHAQIDSAPIGTIHAWCASILRRFALDLGLDPQFRILDAVATQALARATTTTLIRQCRIGVGPPTDRLGELFSESQVREAVRTLYAQRHGCRSWSQRLRTDEDEAIVNRWRGQTTLDLIAHVRTLIEPHLDGLISLVKLGRSDSLTGDAQRVLLTIGQLPSATNPLRDLRGLWLALSTANNVKPRAFTRSGRKSDYKNNEDVLAHARRSLSSIGQALADVCVDLVADLDEASLPALRQLAGLLDHYDALYTQAKQARGALDFEDLLLLTQRLLAEYPDVVAELRNAYRFLLVDEFQDVNRVQWSVMERLALESDGELKAGKLFCVGDDKQSIYRFRGAELEIFANLKKRLGANARGELVPLTTNYRTLKAPLTFINALFDALLSAGSPSSPRPSPLHPHRADGDGSTTLLLATDGDEAQLIASHVANLLRQGGESTPGHHGRQLLQPSDIAVLLRQRTRLQPIVRALRLANIPVTVASGNAFYRDQAVSDLIALCEALAFPDRDLPMAIVARSPLCALTDDTLVALCLGTDGPHPGLRSRLQQVQPELFVGNQAQAVEQAAALFAKLSDQVDRVPTRELLIDALVTSGALYAYGRGPEGEQCVANIEKLLELVHELEPSCGNLAELATMLSQQLEHDDGEAEAELADLPNAVRVLTVHGSKGLEFPVVIVADGAAAQQSDRSPLRCGQIEGHFEVAIKVRDPLQGQEPPQPTGLYSRLQRHHREQECEEHKRLLYVALTRARDHLVISGTLRQDAETIAAASDSSWLSWLLAWLQLPPAALDGATGPGACWTHAATGLRVFSTTSYPAPPPQMKVKEAEHTPSALAVTELAAPQQQTPMGEARLSPSRWGRFRLCPMKVQLRERLGLVEPPTGAGGRDDGAMALVRGTIVHKLIEDDALVGTTEAAVRHRVVRLLKLMAPAELERWSEPVVQSALKAQRVLGCGVAAKLLTTALASYREHRFALQLPTGMVTGTLDLLVQTPRGWHVVDWKTDSVAAEHCATHSKTHGYLDQLDLYALAVALLCGGFDPQQAPGDLAAEIAGTLVFTDSGAECTTHYGAAKLHEVYQAVCADLTRIAASDFAPPQKPPCSSCGYATPGAGYAGSGVVCPSAPAYIASTTSA